MKWRLFLGLILCVACTACVKKVPPQFIVPSPPSVARSVQLPFPSGQPGLKGGGSREVEPSPSSLMTAETKLSDAEHAIDVVTPQPTMLPASITVQTLDPTIPTSQSELEEKTLREAESLTSWAETPDLKRDQVEHTVDAVAPEIIQSEKNRLVGCMKDFCSNGSGMGQGSGRYLVYKRTSYIGYLPMRTAYFSVKCANQVEGEELFLFKGKWCLISGKVGLENKCHGKQHAMKLACTRAESPGVE